MVWSTELTHVQVHYFVGFDPEQNMYHTIAINVFEFREIDALPTALNQRFDSCSSPDELSQLLMNEKAGFHKQKVERKRYEK